MVTTAVELSADDLRALRTAGTVSFHYYDGHGYMMLTLDIAGERSGEPRTLSVAEQRAFPQSVDRSAERRRIIDVTTEMHGYGHDGRSFWNVETEPRAAAFEMISTASLSQVWRTVTSLMRKGDLITLKWTADNNTDNIRHADLHCDQLQLIITRGETRLTFNLVTAVRPDNSARMVLRNGTA